MDRDAAIQRLVRLPRRGGPPRAAVPAQCDLYDELKSLWSGGLLSPPAVQRLAAAYCRDERRNGRAPLPEMERLQQIGTEHTRRRVLRALPVSPTTPPIFKLRVPCLPIKSESVRPTFLGTSMMLPTILLEFLYRHNPRKFANFLGNGLANFWGNVRDDDPKLIGHPMLANPAWRTKAIPLVLHGDGVQFTMKGNSLLCVLLARLLCQGWAANNVFLLACWPKACRSYGSVHGPLNDT